MIIGGSQSHIAKKAFEMLPALAYRYPASTIPLICGAVLIGTSLPYPSPYSVFWEIGIGELRIALLQRETATRPCMVFLEVWGTYTSFIAAITAANERCIFSSDATYVSPQHNKSTNAAS